MVTFEIIIADGITFEEVIEVLNLMEKDQNIIQIFQTMIVFKRKFR